MESRKEQVIKYAFIGGATGFVFGGTVGYLISDTCSFVPEYFDKMLEQSVARLDMRFTDVATLFLPRGRLHDVVNTTMSSMFGECPKINAVTNDVVKLIAKSRLNMADLSLPVIGELVTKTLSVTHPTLMHMASLAYGVTIDVVKAGLVAQCMETMDQYKIFPAVCLGSTLLGAGIGALTGLAKSSQTTQAAESTSNHTSTRLYSQSLFNDKAKKMAPASQPKQELHRPRSFSV